MPSTGSEALLTSAVSAATGAQWPGRRLRIFARIVHATSTPTAPGWQIRHNHIVLAACDAQPNYAGALALVAGAPSLAALPLREERGNAPAPLVRDRAAVRTDYRNPSLPSFLRDLREEVIADLREAFAAFDDPDVWYPGVDEGIAPVADRHVALVIAATERELTHERRAGPAGGPSLPPAPLRDLPWRVQRAYVERRRLRFAQFGIDTAEWERGTFSLWRVPEDPDWIPRVDAA